MNTLHGNGYLGVRKIDSAAPPVRRPVVMVARRCLRAGRQRQFDLALRSFLDFAVSFPGHLDVHVVSWVRDEVVHFAVVNRFADAAARQNFTSAPGYRAWLVWLQKSTDEEAAYDTACANVPRLALPPSWSPMWVGAVLALALFGLAGILSVAIYLGLSAWHAGTILI